MAAFLASLLLLLLLPSAQPADMTVVADTTRAVGIARPDTVLALPPVTVRAKATPRMLTAGRRLTSLSSQDMEAAGAQSVADLLEARTGFYVRRYGAGGLATASLRGASSQQTLLLLDGQRLADPQTGQVDLSLLPTALLRSADVAYGASSARHGSGAFGGVVRLHTLRTTRNFRFKAVGGAGAWGARNGSLALSGGGARLSGLVAAELETKDGDFPYDADARSAARGRRSGGDRRQRTLFGKARYQRGAHAVRALAWLSDAERGLSGRVNAPPSRARQWDRHLRLQLEDRWNQPWGLLHLSARTQSTWRRYRNPAPESPVVRADDTTRTRTLTLSARAEAQAGRVALTGGLEAGLDHARLRGGVQRLRTAGFLDATFSLGRLRLRPALRLDALREDDGRRTVALSPRLGVSVQPLRRYESLRLKAGAGRSFRAPTFSERFREPGGAPDLRAETGWSVDAGVAWRAERPKWNARAEATAFALRMDDQIVWQPTYVGAGVQVWRPGNVGRVLTRGVEVSAQGRRKLTERVGLGGGAFFTHARAENRSNPAAPAFGKQLPHRPIEQLKLNLRAKVKLGAGRVQAGVNGRLVGPRFVATDESNALPPHRVFDARLRYEHPVGPLRLGLGLWLENAADAEYQIVRFYPMPPRHLRLRLTLETAP